MSAVHSLPNRGRKVSAPPKTRSVWIYNIVVLAVALTIMYFLFPQLTKRVVFDVGLRNGWYALPVMLWLHALWRYAAKNDALSDMLGMNFAPHRRAIGIFLTTASLIAVWGIAVFNYTDYLVYKMYASGFTARDVLVPSAPDFVRFTPLENACTDIGNSISSTGEHVECSHVQPIITEHGFGYAAPITPSGGWNTFFEKNPGFLLLDDAHEVNNDPKKRLVRINETQEIGQGMEWFDNLNYILARTDFFANFDTPHFLALDASQPHKLTLVVPKIKYGMLFRLPYWGGDVLVHANGKVEDLSAEEARKDPRLAGKWIYPISLARKYVHLQNYAAGHGIYTPFARLSGMLEIEKLEGGNQFPLLTQGNDGKTYLVTATKGQGSATGLFRMYFVDAATGDGTFHQFKTDEVVYGARAASLRITNIPGYQWYHKGKGDKESSGNMIATEPVYVVRANDPTLYWKYTITNVQHSGISATAVANASKPDEITPFKTRDEFEAWKRGTVVASVAAPAASAAPVGQLGQPGRREIEQLIQGIQTQLGELQKRVQALPQ